jgi:hypothetical protein
MSILANISVAASLEKSKLSSSEPWYALVDITWTNGEHLRLVRNTDDITFDARDGNGPQTYTAFNWEFDQLEMKSDGSLPTWGVRCSNGTGDASIGSMSDISRLSISGTTSGAGAPVMIYNTGTSGALRGLGLLAPNAGTGNVEVGAVFMGTNLGNNNCAFISFGNDGGNGSTNNHGAAGMCGQSVELSERLWTSCGWPSSPSR